MNNCIINSDNQQTFQILFEAINFAAFHHRHQKRKGAAGIPYINHPLNVTNLIVSKLNSPGIILLCAAILHDIIEDTKVSAFDLQKKFGAEITNLVLEVSDNMLLPSFHRKRIQVEKITSLSSNAKAIKIADKTCNIKDILSSQINWNNRRKIKYISWAKEVIDQIRDSHPSLIEEFDMAILHAKKELNHSF